MKRSYKDIEYSLKQSKRKTASIYIERDGQVSILAPDKMTTDEIEKLIESKRVWLYRSLAEWSDLNATRIQREFVSGEGFMYLGRSYRLRLVKEQDKPLMLKDGYFCLQVENGTNRDAERAFRDFYRDKGKERIPGRVGYYADKLGVKPKGMRVLDLKNRWASCSAKGNLNFHWKCMMAPLTILDYIVVHELVHLVHPTHTKEFWNEVDKIIPDYRERKEWLRINGAGMDI